MSTETATTQPRTPLWASPGLIVGVLFGLLILLVAIGVIVTNMGGGGELQTVTISDLRAQPAEYDNQTVLLMGTAEDVRQLPILDQYALYTFRDDTGSMWALSQRGAPPRDGETVHLTAVFHSRLTLDEQIRLLVEEQFGSLAGSIAGGILPDLGVSAVFLEHQGYDLVNAD